MLFYPNETSAMSLAASGCNSCDFGAAVPPGTTKDRVGLLFCLGIEIFRPDRLSDITISTIPKSKIYLKNKTAYCGFSESSFYR